MKHTGLILQNIFMMSEYLNNIFTGKSIMNLQRQFYTMSKINLCLENFLLPFWFNNTV